MVAYDSTVASSAMVSLPGRSADRAVRVCLTARQSYLVALEAALAAEKAASTPERAVRRRKKAVVA